MSLLKQGKHTSDSILSSASTIAASIVTPEFKHRTLCGRLEDSSPFDSIVCWKGAGEEPEARREPLNLVTGTIESGWTWGSASSPLPACAFPRLILSAWRCIVQHRTNYHWIHSSVQRLCKEVKFIYNTFILRILKSEDRSP